MYLQKECTSTRCYSYTSRARSIAVLQLPRCFQIFGKSHERCKMQTWERVSLGHCLKAFLFIYGLHGHLHHVSGRWPISTYQLGRLLCSRTATDSRYPSYKRYLGVYRLRLIRKACSNLGDSWHVGFMDTRQPFTRAALCLIAFCTTVDKIEVYVKTEATRTTTVFNLKTHVFADLQLAPVITCVLSTSRQVKMSFQSSHDGPAITTNATDWQWDATPALNLYFYMEIAVLWIRHAHSIVDISLKWRISFIYSYHFTPSFNLAWCENPLRYKWQASASTVIRCQKLDFCHQFRQLFSDSGAPWTQLNVRKSASDSSMPLVFIILYKRSATTAMEGPAKRWHNSMIIR